MRIPGHHVASTTRRLGHPWRPQGGVREMTWRRTLHRTRVPVVMCVLLLVPAGCDVGGTSHASGAPGAPKSAASAPATTTAPDGGAALTGRTTGRREPVPCPSARTRSWTLQDVTTVSRGVDMGPVEVVVSGTGQTTLAWTAAPGGFDASRPRVIRIATAPPVPGDPQAPPGPPDPQNPRDAQVDALIAPTPLGSSPNGDLGIDAAGVQT